MSYREANTEIRMQRITITIEDDLLAEIDAAAEARGYQNRSEIIRDLARAGLQQNAEGRPVRPMRRRLGLCLRSRRARTLQAAGAEFPRPPRSVAGDAACPSRRRQLHGGDGAEGRQRRRPAFRRPHHRRAWRALRPCGDDPDRAEQRSRGHANTAITTTDGSIAGSHYLSERPITAISSAIFSRWSALLPLVMACSTQCDT